MRENSIFKDRILQYIEYKGISKYECYQNTGITNGILSQKNGMTEDSILKFLSYYKDINPDWLILGQGSMLREENKIADLISYDPSVGVPYYDVDFTAGFDAIFNNQTLLPAHNIVFKPFEEAQLWCNVTGDSMADRINSGDIIALKEISLESILYGEIYAVVLDDVRTVKILRKSSDPNRLRFIPINKEYDEQEFEKCRIQRVYAVLGSIRKFF
ncbi:MAG: S24 family peptidase [Odoribacter sp.]